MIIIIKAKKREYTPPSIPATLFCLLLLFLLFYFLKSPELAAASVMSALDVCARGLIPSLFPFIVLVSMLNLSGASGRISSIIGRPIAWIFGIDKCAASAILLGSLGGFPIGAVCARSLYERGELSQSDAARLITFTNNASPAFCIGTIGIALFGDTRFGVKLYLCQLAAACVIGIAQRKRQISYPTSRSEPTQKSVSDTVTSSIAEGGATMLKICAFAVFFAVVGDAACVVMSRFFGDHTSAICTAFIELTLAARKCADIGTHTARLLCAFAVGFSGISVHMQAASVLSGSGITMRRYYTCKVLQGLLSSTFMLVLSYLSLP